MPRSCRRPNTFLPVILLGTVPLWSSAQVDLPPLEASSRPTLERPRSWEPANRPATSVNSRSSSRGTSKIPDPTIFDGSQFPEEERPEQAMISQFEVPGGQPPPPTQNEQGPGQQQGAGGQGQGGDGGQQQGGGQMAGGGGGGPQIPGMPPMGGGGGGEGEQGDGSLPQIAESQMGDPNAQGEEGEGQGGGGQEGPEGEQGQPGGPGGSPDAPQVAADQQGRALERPSEVQIGEEGASIAEAGVPEADASKQLENAPGEDRMSVKAASGNQTANRGKGTEQGVVMPSNL